MFCSCNGTRHEGLQSLFASRQIRIERRSDVLKTAALLHDIARVKEFNDKTGSIDHSALGAEMADEILRTLGYSEEKTVHVKHYIARDIPTFQICT